ncbi:MAG: DEAD/DEAH box helicase [Cyanobacteria bacterium]|nr:DEAD/DEAH box helicase [Cyanobacteriota bacterium]
MTLSFHSIGLSEARVKHLDSMGFTEPTQIQAEAIPPLLAGKDVVGLAQTGTGKTAAFALPMLERLDPQTKTIQALILTPTRELAQQVSTAISSFVGGDRFRVTTVYGGQSIDRQIQQLQRGTQVVVGTPGRIIDLMERGDLKLEQATWAVLDEADEMLNMGFIQDVERIFAVLPADRQTTFFSATMSAPVRKLVAQFLRSPVWVTVEQPHATPQRIEQVAYILPRGCSKVRALQPILETEDPEAAIIFVRTKQTASDLTAQLQAAGYSADEYHGNLTQSQRERMLVRFRRGQLRWIVATDIAARGIDVDRLTHVINYDLPDNLENYVHRIGRTGRAGRTGTAITLVHALEKYRVRHIERYIRQPVEVKNLPTRADIEARRIDRMKERVQETLAGERVASFLPLVSQLEEEYDPRAVAAAVLQMLYDLEQPNWHMESIPGDDRPAGPNKGRMGGGGGGDRARRSGGGGRRDYGNSGGEGRAPAPRPRLRQQVSSGDRNG